MVEERPGLRDPVPQHILPRGHHTIRQRRTWILDRRPCAVRGAEAEAEAAEEAVLDDGCCCCCFWSCFCRRYSSSMARRDCAAVLGAGAEAAAAQGVGCCVSKQSRQIQVAPLASDGPPQRTISHSKRRPSLCCRRGDRFNHPVSHAAARTCGSATALAAHPVAAAHGECVAGWLMPVCNEMGSVGWDESLDRSVHPSHSISPSAKRCQRGSRAKGAEPP